MKRLFFYLAFLISGVCAAQNITVIEYFFDTDPGIGSGTPVTITPSPTITDLTFNISIASVADGFHTLSVRTKDASNNWSNTFTRPFYKLPASAVASAPNINKLEYFFDADPGFGAGTNVTVTAGTSINALDVIVPLTSVADGFHTLSFRTRDANNNWSNTFTRPFYKLPASAVVSAPNINKLEYFFDADPGFGAGTNVTVTAGTSINALDVIVPLTSVADGFHTLSFRTRDANNNWSNTFTRPFYKLPASAVASAPNINKLEYFFDADPGFGAGTNVTVTAGTSITALDVIVPLTSVADGFHTLSLRTRDANNNWSNTFTRPFYKLPASAVAAAPNITRLEYFIDDDEGFGPSVTKNKNVTITPGTSISLVDLVADVSSLSIGTHKISFRAQDANGNWSIVHTNTFLMLGPQPTAQPTGLLFSNVLVTSMTVSWTAAAGSPAGYLVLRKVGSSPTEVPVDGTDYAAGNTLGTSTVVFVGSALTFNSTSLTAAANYYYAVFSYNGTTGLYNYLTTSPLTGNRSTLATEPTAQANGINFSNITNNSMSVAFSAASGGPAGYIGLRKTGSSPTDVPVDGTAYTAGNTIGTSTVAFVGSGTTFSVTGLAASTVYYFDIFSYNGTTGTYNYLATTPLEGSQTTLATQPATQPTAISFSNVTDVSMTVSFTAATGSPGGYIGLRKTGSSPTDVPVNGTTYSAGSTIGTSSVAFVGSGVSFSVTGLSANTVYFFDIFAYNGTTGTYNYLTTSPLEGSQTTLTLQPSFQPTSINFSNVTDVSMTVSFTAATGSPAGYIGLRKTGSSPTDVPIDGAAYTVGNTIGTSIVAFVGTGTTFSITGLSASTVYFYDIFAYNGTTGTYNYLTTTPLEGSQTTLATQPSAQPTAISFSNVTDVSMTVSFTAATGSPTGYIALRKATSSPTDVPADGMAYSIGNIIGSSTVAFVGAGVTFQATGLSSGINYCFDIFSFNGATGTYNYLTTGPLEGCKATLITKPGAQPTNMVFSNVTDVSMTVSFTAATGSPSGYLALRKAGSSPADVPVDGTTYSAGNNLGTSTIAYFGSAATFPSTGLSASTVYHYDIFSFNGSTGTYSYLTTSPLEGSRTTLATEPSAQPTNLQFTSVTSNSYTVGFTIPASAPAGYIAIRKTGSAPSNDPDDGSSYSVGNPHGDGTIAYVGSAATFNESGLNSATQYFYKIYSFNGSAATTNYRTTTPLQGNITSLGSQLSITLESFPGNFDKGSTLTVSVTVSDATKASGVVLKYRGISEAPSALKTVAVTPTGNKFEKVISSSDLTDAIGLKYYFEVTDLSLNTITSNTGKSYVRYSTEQIPGLSFGDKVSNYSIIAVPFKSSIVTTVFSALGQYDQTQWRLFDYSGGDNREYAAFSTIEPGKGYWLIARNSTIINPGTNTAVEVDESTPFTITLVPGWNLIGNPYNFPISWSEVLTASGNPANVSATLTQFSNGTLTANGTQINRFRGAFIENKSAGNIPLTIPVLRNPGLTGGRIATREADLEKQEWEVDIEVTDGDLTNAVGGLGMHPSATLIGEDAFDKIRPPLLNGMNMPELIFTIPNRKEIVNKEVVPTKENFTWQFDVKQFEGAPVKLNWSSVGEEGSKKLYILDPVTQRVVDMKAENELPLSSNSKSIKVLFGNSDYIERALEQELPTMGQPYPNPARKEVTIPFYISEILDNAKVTIRVYDNLGSEVNILADDFYKTGRHLIKWEPDVRSGLYIITMKVGSGEEKRVKIIIQ